MTKNTQAKESQGMEIQVLALPFMSYVTLAKSLNLSGPSSYKMQTSNNLAESCKNWVIDVKIYYEYFELIPFWCYTY